MRKQTLLIACSTVCFSWILLAINSILGIVTFYFNYPWYEIALLFSIYTWIFWIIGISLGEIKDKSKPSEFKFNNDYLDYVLDKPFDVFCVAIVIILLLNLIFK